MDWDFGLTDRLRRPDPALATVRRASTTRVSCERWTRRRAQSTTTWGLRVESRATESGWNAREASHRRARLHCPRTAGRDDVVAASLPHGPCPARPRRLLPRGQRPVSLLLQPPARYRCRRSRLRPPIRRARARTRRVWRALGVLRRSYGHVARPSGHSDSACLRFSGPAPGSLWRQSVAGLGPRDPVPRADRWRSCVNAAPAHDRD